MLGYCSCILSYREPVKKVSKKQLPAKVEQNSLAAAVSRGKLRSGTRDKSALVGWRYHERPIDHAVAPDEAYFWGTEGGAELDHLLFKDGRRRGVECKRVDAPKLTPSMHNALDDLDLDHLVVICPGARAYPLADRVTVLSLTQIAHGGHAQIALREA